MVKPNKCISSFALSTLQCIVLLTIYSPRVATAEYEEFCPIEARVNLPNAMTNSSGFLAESGFFFPKEKVKLINGAWRGCMCDLKPCLHLCPPIEEADYANYSAFPSVYTTNLTFDHDAMARGAEEWFHVLVRDPCPDQPSFDLDRVERIKDEFYLLGNGSLFRPRMVEGEQLLFSNEYCLVQLEPNESSYTPRVCSSINNMDLIMTVKYFGSLLNIPFLVLTVLVYSVLPELRNIHGRTLRCYLSCLIVTYLVHGIDRMTEFGGIEAWNFHLCLSFRLIIYSSFLASFFWLNVMCFDMWWTFGGFDSLRSSGTQLDRKKFMWYSIYAWGITVILTAIQFGIEFSRGTIKELIYPGFKKEAGWFRTKTTAALYFYGPVGVTIISNICFFILTSIKVVHHEKSMKRHLNSGESSCHHHSIQSFQLQLKLFVVMGISWSTQIISWLLANPEYLWHFTDIVNLLQGFLIFVIFLHCICLSRHSSSDLPTTATQLKNGTIHKDPSV